MTPEDVVDVLTKLSAYDQRTIGEADVAAWFTVLGRYEIQDALIAVEVHYGESSHRAMPSDIKKLTINVREQREARERQVQRRLAIESDPTTRDRSAEVTALVQQVADALPDPTPQDKAIARARRERGRPEPPKPKLKKRPKRRDWAPPATDEIARFAMRYLIDGHSPADVSERLAVSKKWCEQMVRKFRRSTEGEAS
jgi:hypothetical protein